MRTGIVLMALGVVFLTQLPLLPDAFYVSFLPLCLLTAWLKPALRPVALFACGLLWALGHAQWLKSDVLPSALEGQVLVIDGRVVGLPSGDRQRLRFEFRISRARRDGDGVELAGRKVRLSWYRQAPIVLPGQQWQLAVRLRRPRGLLNPGGRDYERWLFTRGISATGHVMSRAGNRLTTGDAATGLDGLRHSLSKAITEQLAGQASAGIVAALAVGDRSGLSNAQWHTFRATGTSHLMAISGLHIGLVAGLVFFLVVRLWSALGTPVLWLAAPQAGALVALVAGVVYAGLAGFALPTQRALVMLAVIMAGVILCRRVAPSTSFCLALITVLVADPFAVLSVGFWLSFGAVAAILLGMSARLRALPGARWQRLWWRWGRVQWLVAVALLPATMSWFLEYPLLAPLANVLAVPWAGLVLVPLVLGATALLLPFPALGGGLLAVAGWAADVLWQLLDSLAGLDWVLPADGAPAGPALAAACVGAALLIAPRGFPSRALGVIWLLPMLLPLALRPAHGDYWMTLLDVGQGLAAVVRTRAHVLVYDTGPRYAAGFDAGRDVVAPYLRHQGIDHVDLLILSHGHNDHVGGARALMERVPVKAIMSNVHGAWRPRKACLAGHRWRWDGVEFRIVHPASAAAGSGNNGSCVLKVTGAGGRLLLPGDVEADGEAEMLARNSNALRADVLVIPHHGGRSSSGVAFLDAVRPELALFPVGYRNRYRFPHRQVLRRLADRAVTRFDTARHGAISLRFDADVGIQGPRLERRARIRIWRTPD
jgi:competence protein ComEC